jgi:hypothetical protein
MDDKTACLGVTQEAWMPQSEQNLALSFAFRMRASSTALRGRHASSKSFQHTSGLALADLQGFHSSIKITLAVLLCELSTQTEGHDQVFVP